MTQRKPTGWRVYSDHKYARDRLLALAYRAGWDPTCAGSPDQYLEEKVLEWLRIKDTLAAFRRMLT